MEVDRHRKVRGEAGQTGRGPGNSLDGLDSVFFRYTPNGDEDECWLDVTNTVTGRKSRRHYATSEWTRDFRTAVVDAWLPVFKQHVHDIEGASSEAKQRNLQMRKESTAERFDLTIEEFQEILEATD